MDHKRLDALNDLAARTTRETAEDHREVASNMASIYGPHIGAFFHQTLEAYTSYAMLRTAATVFSDVTGDTIRKANNQFIDPFTDMVVMFFKLVQPFNGTEEQRKEVFETLVRMMLKEDERIHDVLTRAIDELGKKGDK